MTEPGRLESLDEHACLELLAASTVGRIGLLHDGIPVVLPLNYRLVRGTGVTPGDWIAVRTRRGNVIDQPPTTVAFEIDGYHSETHEGWSVMVQGELHHLDADVAEIRRRFDSDTWLTTERDAWLLIEPFSITGRRLAGPDAQWTLSPPPPAP